MIEKDRVKLCKSNVLSDMSNSRLKKCDHCLVEKKCKFSFEIDSPIRRKILDLMHCHLCGLMKTRTMEGSAYFLTFVYDDSRKTLVYTMKSKHEVFESV